MAALFDAGRDKPVPYDSVFPARTRAARGVKHPWTDRNQLHTLALFHWGVR